MLINVNFLPTPYRKTEKIEEFENFDVHVGWNGVEKEQEEGRMLIQNKCAFSSQNKRNEKRRGRHGWLRRPFCFPTFPQRAVRLLSLGRTGSLNRDISKPSGNTHKIPEKTNCRRDRDFQTNKTKMQMSLRTD